MVNMGIQVLIVGSLLHSFLIGASFYLIWPIMGIEWATTPPHVTFVWFSVLGWLSNFIAIILFWSYTRGSNTPGR